MQISELGSNFDINPYPIVKVHVFREAPKEENKFLMIKLF